MTLPMFAAEHIVIDADRDWWCTPPHIVEVVRDALGGRIDFDPCSNPLSMVGASFTVEAAADGLSAPWPAPVCGYCNPPYSDPAPWMQRCADAGDLGSRFVGCIKADTSTIWWHRSIWGRAKAICFPSRRVAFLPPPGVDASTPDFAVAFPFWAPAHGDAVDTFARAMSSIGKVVIL